MSSKTDRLLKKATSFERLALYGDRKSFLQALAQQPLSSTESSPWSMYDEAGDPRGNQQNWVPQVENGQRTYNYVGPNVPASSVQHTPSLWEKYVTPHKSNELPNVVRPPVDHSDQASQIADRDPTIMMQKRLNAPAVPEQDAPARPAPGYDKETISLLQSFLNNAMRDELTKGQYGLSPLVPDGKVGPDTTKFLQLWAGKNKIPATNIQSLLNTAINASKR